MFRKATKKDIVRILQIQEENLLKNSKEGEGFLIYPLTKKALESASSVCFVVVQNEQIVGYFQGSPRKTQTTKEIKLPGKIFYGKHICLSGSVKGGGVIKQFEAFCLQELQKMKFSYLIGEICLKPLNKRSFDFHVKVQGFERLSSYADRLGYTWGIFLKKL